MIDLPFGTTTVARRADGRWVVAVWRPAGLFGFGCGRWAVGPQRACSSQAAAIRRARRVGRRERRRYQRAGWQ